MTLRPATAPLLAAALLASLVAACDDGARPRRSDDASADTDEWGENAPEPTRDEILAAPDQHGADAVTEALVDVAENADASALPSLLRLADDDREEVRWHVVLALKAIDADAARTKLAELAADDPSDLVREEAAR